MEAKASETTEKRACAMWPCRERPRYQRLRLRERTHIKPMKRMFIRIASTRTVSYRSDPRHCDTSRLIYQRVLVFAAVTRTRVRVVACAPPPPGPTAVPPWPMSPPRSVPDLYVGCRASVALAAVCGVRFIPHASLPRAWGSAGHGLASRLSIELSRGRASASGGPWGRRRGRRQRRPGASSSCATW